ncbi:hypothetical protein L2764_27390 [Shewanella surugensis]|uniref:Uncharacterized protein n=1 Tax=Shewanella surugensis TaxID=212020 RepID=A0ABT0LK48_9GAMM|nr:hypothetical protein [Shewanella surugensis]MCL1128058.1 hypothetical protein [Shewanella surugensis]
MKQSYLHGTSDTVALYLDAESNYNKILDNEIEVNTAQQLMALDGSAHNKIENNYFILNDNGGIYLYRNCGEGGTVHHQKPSFNQIKANYFSYNNISDNNSNNPAIYISANNGQQSYCTDDDEALNEATTYANIMVPSFRPDAKAETIDFECLIATNSEGYYKYLTCPRAGSHFVNKD